MMLMIRKLQTPGPPEEQEKKIFYELFTMNNLILVIQLATLTIQVRKLDV